MANRLKSVGDGTATASAVQTGKSCIPSAEGVVSVEQLRERPWLLANKSLPEGDHCAAYSNGCAHGAALASSHLKNLLFRPVASNFSTLQWFILGIIDKEALSVAQQGQIVGLCSALEPWLRLAVQCNVPNLRALSDEDILASLNDAIAGGPGQRESFRIKQFASDNARKAANARWAKHREAQHA